MESNRNNNTPRDGEKRPRSGIWGPLLITVAIVLIISGIYNAVTNGQYTQTRYDEFMAAKEANQLEEVVVRGDRIIYLTKEEAAKPAAQQQACYTGLPSGGDNKALMDELYAQGV